METALEPIPSIATLSSYISPERAALLVFLTIPLVYEREQPVEPNSYFITSFISKSLIWSYKAHFSKQILINFQLCYQYEYVGGGSTFSKLMEIGRSEKFS